MPNPPIKPGWYPDPLDAHLMRYWDGRDWAERYRAQPPWASSLEEMAAPAEGYEGAVEGPVHPHELRAPVTSGASSSRDAASLWPPRPGQRSWQRPSELQAGSSRAPVLIPATKFVRSRRPLLTLVSLFVVAAAAIISSIVLMSPGQRPLLPHLAEDPAGDAYTAQVQGLCQASLAPNVSMLLASDDGPGISRATDRLDALSRRISTLKPSPDMVAPVESWLADWRELAQAQRRYASVIGAGAKAGDAVRLSPGQSVVASGLRTDVLAIARQADHYASNLRLASCMLKAPSS